MLSANASVKVSAIKALIRYLLHFIAVGCKGEYSVVAMFCTVDAVKQQAVIIDFANRIMMVVPIDAAHQPREEIKITAECLSDVVIELVTIGRRMHHDDSTVEVCGIFCCLFFHKVEVWYCCYVVILCSVGIETDKLDS